MTIREIFDRRKRQLMSATLVGFAIFAGGLVATSASKRLDILLCLPGFAIAVLATLYGYYFASRCPRWAVSWQALAMHMGKSPFAIDARIRYCPFCGADVDEKLEPVTGATGSARLTSGPRAGPDLRRPRLL